MTDEQIDKLCAALRAVFAFQNGDAIEHVLGTRDGKGLVDAVYEVASSLEKLALAHERVAEVLNDIAERISEGRGP